MSAASPGAARAYLAGVLHGAGWCTPQSFGLNVLEREFCQAFVDALRAAGIADREPRARRGGYWRVAIERPCPDFALYEPNGVDEQRAWLRGLFDAVGSVALRHTGASARSRHRRVAFYSTAQATLERARTYLAALGIPSVLRPQSGASAVHELRVRGSQAHYGRVAAAVGASVGARQRLLDDVAGSYLPPGEASRAGQRRAAATRHQRLLDRVPEVVRDIATLMRRGYKPTQRECAKQIVGYSSLQRYYAQADLVAMATELLSPAERARVATYREREAVPTRQKARYGVPFIRVAFHEGHAR